MTDRFKFRVAVTNEDGLKTIYYTDINGKPLLLNSHGDVFLAGADVLGETTLERARWSNNVNDLMFSTGLRDKNGKLIYEGDIIKNQAGTILEITWSDSLSGFVSCNIKNIEVGGWPWFNSEIIGNIHEHPELLELLEQKT